MLLQDISGLIPEETYTFSAYIKTENMASAQNVSHNGAFLLLSTQDSATSLSVYSESITENTDENFDKGWKRLTATITLPTGCKKVRAYIQMRNMTGTVYADGIQFEADEYAHPVNLLENSGFEKFSSDMPSSWTTSNISHTEASDGTVTEGITIAHDMDGDHSFRIKGDANKDKYLSQTIPVSGNPYETYSISGWSFGLAVPSFNHSDAKYEISVSVRYKKTDGTYRNEDKPPVEFNPTISGWQYAARTFALVSKEHPSDIPVSITIQVQYAHQANHAYFDKLQLVRDNANTYTYDSDGNMISVSANAKKESELSYTGSDLTSVTDSAGYSYTYTYDDNHNLLTAKSAGNVTTQLTYGSVAGLPSTISIKNSDGSREIKQSINYSLDGDFRAGSNIESVRDERGGYTYYDYDGQERLNQVKKPNLLSTYYEYVSSSNDRLAKVYTKDGNTVLSTVRYAYDGDRLSSLMFGDDTYTFEVDQFGNARSASINGKLLSVNTYNDYNGKLYYVTYRTGDVREYTYNWLGQVLGIGNRTNIMYRYVYDLNGTLKEFIDNMAQRKTLYTADSLFS